MFETASHRLRAACITASGRFLDGDVVQAENPAALIGFEALGKQLDVGKEIGIRAVSTTERRGRCQRACRLGE
jgi:hypothetical protein